MRSSITFGFLANGVPIMSNRKINETVDHPGIEDTIELADVVSVVSATPQLDRRANKSPRPPCRTATPATLRLVC
jgi:hypothetical protein